MARKGKSADKLDEQLLGEIRGLRKENKALRKRLKQLEKNQHIYNEFKLDLEEAEILVREPIKEDKHKDCPDCGRRKVEVVSILNREWDSCTLCGWRSVARIIDE